MSWLFSRFRRILSRFALFFSGTFILATNNGDVNIVRTGDYCDPHSTNTDGATGSPLNLGSGFNYCGINKFNFAARTAGSSV